LPLKAGWIKPARRGDSSYHLILLAKNEEGYQNFNEAGFFGYLEDSTISRVSIKKCSAAMQMADRLTAA